jgi:hypothetical protein
MERLYRVGAAVFSEQVEFLSWIGDESHQFDGPLTTFMTEVKPLILLPVLLCKSGSLGNSPTPK